MTVGGGWGWLKNKFSGLWPFGGSGSSHPISPTTGGPSSAPSIASTATTATPSGPGTSGSILGRLTIPDELYDASGVQIGKDPGMYEIIAHKLNLTASQAAAMRSDPSILHELELARPDIANTATNVSPIRDANGVIQSGINFIQPGQAFDLSSTLANKLAAIKGGGVSATDIVRDLSK